MCVRSANKEADVTSKTKGARVDNQTPYPTREVAQIVRFALREQEANDPTLLVRVKRTTWGGKGRYYPRANGRAAHLWDWNRGEWKTIEVKVPRGIAHLITIGLPPSYPRAIPYYDRRETPPELDAVDWREELVAIAAHEAKHHWQWRNRHKRARGRRRFQFKETECDWAAYRTLLTWRAR
jgi:hypothetical protein